MSSNYTKYKFRRLKPTKLVFSRQQIEHRILPFQFSKYDYHIKLKKVKEIFGILKLGVV